MARARQAAHNAPAVLTPQGRLTLTTATPVMTAEAAAQTTIYYTPYVGDRVPLYNGTEWENKVFTELSIAMAASANWATDKNFDLFVYNDAGTLRLVTGAAWTNDTTRAEALVRTNGIWLNNASFTGRYAAASTVSIAASRATYVGTMRTSAAGTTTWEIGGQAAGGDPGRFYLWNCYNRVLCSGYSTEDESGANVSWTYATSSWRKANNSASYRLSFVRGLNEDAVRADYMIAGAQAAPSWHSVAIGLDSESVRATGSRNGPNSNSIWAVATCVYCDLPSAGFHYLQALEYTGASGTTTFYGYYATGDDLAGMSFSGMF